MTKAEKDMGIIKPKYRTSLEKPTPAVTRISRTKGRFGVRSTYSFGRRTSGYTIWYETEKQRDQAFENAERKQHSRSMTSALELEKVER